MEKNIKNIRAEFKKNGIFYTTTELAETFKKYVDFEPATIYDPTCGQGNLLSIFDEKISKYGQELFADELEKAKKRLKNFRGYVGDTLKDDGFNNMKFDLIVANPPFSIKWVPNENDERFNIAPCIPTASKADYAFLLHIIYHLKEKGKAICLQFPGVLYRGQREGKIRKWMIQNNWIERVVHIPGNTFIDTTIATCIIVFNKSKTTTDIIFEDRELKKEKIVKIEEVEENDYTLSVSSYIFKEQPKININPVELNNNAQQAFIKSFQKQLEFEKQICKMEKTSIQPLLDKLKEIINQIENDKEVIK